MPSALTRECFDVGAIVPPCYERYRPVVLDAIDFFLMHLSPLRLSAVVTAQAALPLDASPIERLVMLMQQCPALHKLGQVLARHRRLSPEVRAALQQLETMQPTTPIATIEPVVREALGEAIERYRIELGTAPLAEGSVAVVVPFTWEDPAQPQRGRQAGVFKVLRPSVTEHLFEDLLILARLCDHLDRRADELGLPRIEYRQTFDDVARLLRHEVHLEVEQAHLAEMAARRGEPGVIVPRLCPFQSPQVTAMQRVEGVSVADADGDRRTLARRIVRYLVADVLFSPDDAVLFHADPHAGNLLASTTPGSDVIVLDWSLADRLSREDRQQMMQLTVGMACRDRQAVVTTVRFMAMAMFDESMIEPLVDEHLAGIGPGALPRFSQVVQLFDALAEAGVRFPSRLVLFRKALFTLEGVVADVCPQTSVDDLLQAALVEQVVLRDLPQRLWRPAWSRGVASRLSPLDVGRIVLAWANQTSLWWAGRASQLLIQ